MSSIPPPPLSAPSIPQAQQPDTVTDVPPPPPPQYATPSFSMPFQPSPSFSPLQGQPIVQPTNSAQTGYANVGGVQVYYEVYGPDDGKQTPILFLQGLAGELVGWKILTQYLSHSRQCILMDNRDCGKGDRSHGGYTIEDMADDAAGLLLHLNKSKVNVVGHSMGGCVALALAIRHPSVVHKLFLASTNARPGRYHGFHPIAAWKYLAESGAPRSVIAAQFTATCMSARFIEDHPKQPLYEWPQVSQNPAEFVRQCDAFLRFDAVDQLPRLECPLLVYVGDQDVLAPVVNSREIHELVPGSLLYINEGFSHASLFEDVGHSIQMIDNFFL